MENENELQDSLKPEEEVNDSEFVEEFQDDEPDDEKVVKLTESNKKLFARAKKAEEELKAFKQAPKEEKPQVEKIDPVKISEELIDKRVSEKFEERELDSMELSDSLKTEVRAYAKVKGLSIRQAEKSDYISFLKEQENITKQKNINCKDPINESKFEGIYSKIKNTAYENEKVIVSKKLLMDVCLSSIQIKKVSELFTHDREKLEFMKCANNVLTDKENAKLLADEFQFPETKTDFFKYISK
jgi:hypothetical protein